MRKIVVICGGSGAFTELCGLRDTPDLAITAMPHTCDSGGAQAIFLHHYPEYVALADVDKCLAALAGDPLEARLHRFRFTKSPGDGLSEHRQTVGNTILAAFQNMEPRVPLRQVIAHLARKLELKPNHRVEPITLQRGDVCVRLENGLVIHGEKHIDVPEHDPRVRITEAWLEPAAEANPSALEAIRGANLVVIGPGDLYSSLVPCLLPRGAREVIQETKAKLAYVVNLMTKYGESTGFTSSGFVEIIERYAGRRMDFVVVNTGRPSPELAELYLEEHASLVENDLSDQPGQKVIAADLLETSEGPARHHSGKLANLLVSLI